MFLIKEKWDYLIFNKTGKANPIFTIKDFFWK